MFHHSAPYLVVNLPMIDPMTNEIPPNSPTFLLSPTMELATLTSSPSPPPLRRRTSESGIYRTMESSVRVTVTPAEILVCVKILGGGGLNISINKINQN